MITFEEYLETIHFEENPQLLDDDLPDAFNDWLGELDNDELIIYADQYVKKIELEVKCQAQSNLISEMREIAVRTKNAALMQVVTQIAVNRRIHIQ